MFQARVFQDPLPPRVARNKAPEACPVLCLHLLHNQANLERVIIRVGGMSKPTVSSSTPTSTTFGPTSLRKAKKALMATSSETHSTRATCFTNTVGRKRKVDEPPSLVKKCFRGSDECESHYVLPGHVQRLQQGGGHLVVVKVVGQSFAYVCVSLHLKIIFSHSETN